MSGSVDSSVMIGLQRSRCALLVVDVQERLCAAMPPAVVNSVVKHTGILIETARRMHLPVLVTEQYPKGLGSTHPDLEASLSAIAPALLHRFDKLDFSAAATEPFTRLLPQLARDQWIVVGMETHVCVLQTVRDLRRRQAIVHVISDAVASRSPVNVEIGLSQMAAMGAIISSMETAVFDLLGRASGDDFKALSKLLR